MSSMIISSAWLPITLAWDANSEDDLEGYQIFADASSPPTTLVQTVGAVTTTKIYVPTTGYYFGAKAFDHDGNVSDMSNIVQDA